MSNGLILAGDPQARPLVDALCRRLDVAAVVGLKSTVPGAHFPDLDAALESTPARAVCLLTPNHATFDSIRRLAEAGADVLCAGPPVAGTAQWSQLEQVARQRGVRLRLGGREDHAPNLLKLRELSASAAFGEPVYLRAVTGGGASLRAGWWSLCELFASACSLLQSTPERAFLGAARSGRQRLHITMTVAMRNRANAQLCVTPGERGSFADTWMLGSGGSLSSRGEDGDILVARSDRRLLLGADPEALAEPAWIADFIAGEGDEAGMRPDVGALCTSNHLLTVLRRALKEGRLQRCVVPTA